MVPPTTRTTTLAVLGHDGFAAGKKNMMHKSYSRVGEESRCLAPVLVPACLQTPVDLPLGHLSQEDGAVAATGDVAANGGLKKLKDH